MILFDAFFKDIRLASVNRKRGGSPRYSAHKDYLTGLIMAEVEYRPELPYGGPVEAVIAIRTGKDIDNELKAVFDALQAAGVLENDKQVQYLQKFIVDRDTSARGRDDIRIIIKTLPPTKIKKLFSDFAGPLFNG